MHARARILGHPVHQMLVVFPLGLLVHLDAPSSLSARAASGDAGTVIGK
jgi:hypothetical protein